MASQSDCPSLVLVSQFFHPDTSANSIVLSDLATGLADRGVDVSVVTTQPSYSSEDRTKREPARESYEGVQIRRLPATRFDRNSGLAYRMMNEVSFFFVAFVYLLFRKRGELLLLPTAPSFLPIMGWFLQVRRYHAVPIVMDLYPEMAVQLGYLERGLAYAVWEWFNCRAYRRSAAVVTIGETMKETLESKYEVRNVVVIHNWEDGNFIKPQSKAENPFSAEHDLRDRFTVLYSGNLGRHHDLECLVEAASWLEECDDIPPFTLLFIGEGGQKSRLQELATGLGSVDFLPYQPEEALPDSLTCADVSVVSMAEEVEGLCVSSKFYTALASGQAVLAISTSDGEIGHVVEQTGCGIRVDPDSPEETAEALEYLITNPDETAKMGNRAREVFEMEFTKENSISAYATLLCDLTARDRN